MDPSRTDYNSNSWTGKSSQKSYNPYTSAEHNTERPSGLFTTFLNKISNWGVTDYNDRIILNSKLTGMYDSDQMKYNNPSTVTPGEMYEYFAQRTVSNYISTKAIAYLDSSYAEKRKLLREYSIKEEIIDYVQTICDEAIIYDSKNQYFARLDDLPEYYPETVRLRSQEIFKKIYNRMGFTTGNRAWNLFRHFIVDGYLAFEILYDDRDKNIEGFNMIDVTTIVPAVIPDGDRFQKVWVQYPEDPGQRKIIPDSRIVYLSYSSDPEFTEVSYVEPLIRPFNILTMLEKTKILFNITNCMPYKKFTIPVTDMSKGQAMQQVGALIAKYKENLVWDDRTGNVTINGTAAVPYNKELWFPGGGPTVELLENKGPNLNEDDMLIYFLRKLQKLSKISSKRLDFKEEGPKVYQSGLEIVTSEQKMTLFVGRLRNLFKELIIKPIYIQLLLDFPELHKSDTLLQDLCLNYNTNNSYERAKEMAIINDGIAVVNSLKDFKVTEDGPQVFHLEWLLKEFCLITDEKLAANQFYFQRDAQEKALNINAAPTGAPAGGGDSGMSMGGMDLGGDAGGGMDAAAPESTPEVPEEPPAAAPDTGAVEGV